MPSSYSLFELNEYIRRVIALNFSEPVWINCEIAQVKEVRGNVYLDLIQQDDASHQIIAQISGGIWYKPYLFIKNKLGNLLPSILKEGAHVQLKGMVEYNERYGIKFIIEDIDPAYTIGLLEMKKQKIIQQLKEEGLLDRNKLLSLPQVIQNIAIISSSKAAGYIDFIQHINGNAYGYDIHIDLYEAAMQGQNTERDICQQIAEIISSETVYDCICILRGGGAKTDLSAFDSYNIGAAIAKSKLPVLTGIGHEIDSNVADMVAFKSLKTPTALADFIIETNAEFETNLLDIVYRIGRHADQELHQNQTALQYLGQMLHLIPFDRLKQEHFTIQTLYKNMMDTAQRIIQKHEQSLQSFDVILKMHEPSTILKKGFAMVKQENGLVVSATDINTSKSIQLIFHEDVALLTSYSITKKNK